MDEVVGWFIPGTDRDEAQNCGVGDDHVLPGGPGLIELGTNSMKVQQLLRTILCDVFYLDCFRKISVARGSISPGENKIIPIRLT